MADALAPAGHCARHDFLGSAVAVHFGGIDECHAEVEPDRQRGRFHRSARIALAHPPRSLAELRDARAVGKRDRGDIGSGAGCHGAEDTAPHGGEGIMVG